MKGKKGASGKIGVYPGAFPDREDTEQIVLAHGAGGRKMHRLIRELFLKYFGNPVLNRLEDAAAVRLHSNQICFTTDSYVVQPLFFPGGDIGKLAVAGTVNDLAVCGAQPEFIALGFILREGVRMATVEKICKSISQTAKKAGVTIVTGDTKVIERDVRQGESEGVYINASGVGRRLGVELGVERIRPGDVILINGEVGSHEAAVALARGTYRLKADLKSDCAPLNRLIMAVLECGGVRVMRDPTRGGLATTLNEFAEMCGLGLIVDEQAVPVSRAVRGVAELLGLDPLYMANEGKVVIISARQQAEAILKVMRSFPEGRDARVIGEVAKVPAGVWLKTRLGSLRRLLMLEGEQLPRIC
ncbi:MAG: hydrogenase expression/formation protein HypE [candidate division WOR-3 bacterium]|uniref:Hydrogenase expression/formation protein HypE n=1 Tax=candidate division WOR-3 bacterium TaxID=2052148 RepID=A0A7C1NEA3_UNCW3|nr:hydrogenase expression/formation protein HypE [candidate division WOR-3 bacterium]